MMKILVICTGNTCRSPIAMGLLTGREGIEVDSAGIYACGEPINPNASAVLLEEGIDLSSHVSKPVTKELFEDANLVLVMESAHKTMLKALGYDCQKVKVLDIADPFGNDEECYRKTFEKIKKALENALEA